MTQHSFSRSGAIGVIIRDDGHYLVVERAATVRAPGRLCFPGGGIEPGETDEDAVVRELTEELQLVVQPVRRLWQSHTDSGIRLYWWLVHPTDSAFSPTPNPMEVASWQWMTLDAIVRHPKTLATNRAFLSAVKNGTITISSPKQP